MTDVLAAPPTPRSTFVTVLAWIFIGLATFATVISTFQNVVLALMPAEMTAELEKTASQMPPLFRFLFVNIGLVFALNLLMSLVTLAASIGLLLRRNWGRIAFVVLMVLGIAWVLAGIGFMVTMSGFMESTMGGAPRAPQDFESTFRAMWYGIMSINILLSLGIAILFGWIVKRLVSTEIRREFALETLQP